MQNVINYSIFNFFNLFISGNEQIKKNKPNYKLSKIMTNLKQYMQYDTNKIKY